MAPAMTPGSRQANACGRCRSTRTSPPPSNTEQLLAVVGRVVGVEVAAQAAGTKPSGSRASAKTALPCGSTT